MTIWEMWDPERKTFSEKESPCSEELFQKKEVKVDKDSIEVFF